MSTSTHTSVRLSAALRALLTVAAPQPGDRTAALRALAILGAAAAGLPIDDLRGDLGGLLAVALHPQLHDALVRVYLGEPTPVGGTAIERVAVPPPAHGGSTERTPISYDPRTDVAPAGHAPRTDGAHAEHDPEPAVISTSPQTPDISNPFAVGLEV